MIASAVRRSAGVVGVPVDGILRRVRARSPSVVVLIYHRVGGRSQSPVDLPLGLFSDHLDRLASTCDVIDLDAAEAWLRGDVRPEMRSDRPPVVVTFDDGTADWPDVVLPELAARTLPATFYVSTDFVESGRPFSDDGRPVSWAGLGELVASGLATIASHTHTHRVLADASGPEAASELDRSIGLIEDRLGVACRHFAYPKAIAPSPAAEVAVRRRFLTAALAGNRINVAGRTDLHRLGRHGLTVADGPADFERKVAGGAWLEGWLRERRDAVRN